MSKLRGEIIGFAALETLKYVARSGRVSNLQAGIGELLQVKPILELWDGAATVTARVRGRKRSLQEVIERIHKFYGDRPIHAGMLARQRAGRCRTACWRRHARRSTFDEVLYSDIGPAIAALAGPGVVGLAGCPADLGILATTKWEICMNIALDAMGGDHAPEAIVAGAVEAARVYDVTVSLVGKPDVIEAELKKHDTKGLNLPIVPASQVIEMDDKPAAAVRAKTDSSMVVGCKMVKRGEAQAFVSAGNTGGALAAGILHVGRIKGILRPALIGPFPTLKGACLILDIGANADVRPEHIQQFAIMGSIYARRRDRAGPGRACAF